MISITVNGSQHSFASAAVSVADLLRELSLQGKRLAVERNGEIVPRSMHGDTLLRDGDKIEVVAAVGGG